MGICSGAGLQMLQELVKRKTCRRGSPRRPAATGGRSRPVTCRKPPTPQSHFQPYSPLSLTLARRRAQYLRISSAARYSIISSHMAPVTPTRISTPAFTHPPRSMPHAQEALHGRCGRFYSRLARISISKREFSRPCSSHFCGHSRKIVRLDCRSGASSQGVCRLASPCTALRRG